MDQYMIGSEMGSSSVGIYIIVVKISMVENFKHGCKNDMVDQHGNTFFRGLGGLWRSSFLGNFNPSDKILGLWRTPT
jgi:hypothetical protein